MKIYVMFLIFTSLTFLATLQGQNLTSKLDKVLLQHIAAGEPGVAVLVYEKGQVLYQKGFGAANRQTRMMIDKRTTFRMASVSKQFTAVTILILEKEKKVNFDDNIAKFFPELNPALSDKITLRHLLTHTSGIPDYEVLMDSTWKRQILDQDIVGLLINQTQTYFEPGTKFRYSNTAFCLLAMVTERVSGMPYRQFLQQKVFDKLGMKNSFLYDRLFPVGSRALGFAKNEAGKIVDSDQSLTSATLGDGCVYTSLEDYLIWSKSLRNNELVNVFDKVKQVGFAFPEHPEQGYGLGWFFDKTTKNGTAFSHTGSTCGFSNLVILFPERDILVVCFSNLAANHQLYREITNVIEDDMPAISGTDWWKLHQLTD